MELIAIKREIEHAIVLGPSIKEHRTKPQHSHTLDFFDRPVKSSLR
jgi:hypothetical protein